MTDLTALKAALEAATKGEWRRQDNPDFAEIWAPGGRQPVALVARAEDADAIVATQPRVMREIIAEVERLREALEKIEADTAATWVADVARAAGEIAPKKGGEP